jgi:YidC/Oxa1 family membrane protein insertase
LEKRLPLALFLSFLVLFGWSMLRRPAPEEGAGPGAPTAQGPASPTTGRDAAPADAAEDRVQPSVAATEERTLALDVGTPGQPGHYRATFSNRGASLTRLLFGGYYRRVGLTDEEKLDEENLLPLLETVPTFGGPTGSLLLATAPSTEELAPRGLDSVLWQMEALTDEAGNEVGARFRYGPGTGVVFTKEITFRPGTWHIGLTLGIENESWDGGGRIGELNLVPAGVVPPELGDNFYAEPRVTAVGTDYEEAAEWKGAPNASEPGALDVPTQLTCAGVHNKYFAFLMRDDGPPTMAGVAYYPVEEVGTEVARDLIAAEVRLQVPLPQAGESHTWGYTVYAGPKAPDVFREDFAAHGPVLDSDLSSGVCDILNFTTIGHGLLWILRRFHDLVGNWGVAIILLTFAVRLVLFPINRRSQTAMARYQTKMKRVQPRLDEIKKKHENDPQKLREAQAKIMQEEGAFPPLGGCLPMFLQLPIFFGLFSMLRTSFDLRHQPFYGWIDDLSRPDRLLEIDLALPFIGTIEYFNLLPILMVIMWILQQRGMPQPTDEQAARMQKMMMFMPVVFGFMLYNYAAGLSLYMMTTSTLGIIEQKVIKKVWPIDDAELEKKKKKKSGCGPFAGFMEQLAVKQKEQMKRMEAMKGQQQRPGGKKGKGKKKRR